METQCNQSVCKKHEHSFSLHHSGLISFQQVHPFIASRMSNNSISKVFPICIMDSTCLAGTGTTNSSVIIEYKLMQKVVSGCYILLVRRRSCTTNTPSLTTKGLKELDFLKHILPRNAILFPTGKRRPKYKNQKSRTLF